MAITFVNKGTFNSGAAALTVTQPTSHATGDLLMLFVETANQAISAPSGYTEVYNSPQSTGTAAAAGGVRLGVFYKFATSGAEASVTVADSGDHQTAIIMAFRGVDRTLPFENVAGSVDAAGTTSMSWPTARTFTPNCWVVLAAAMDTDAASTATCTSYTNANLTGITERHDQTVTTGAGGGLAIATGSVTTPTLIGNTTATGSTAVTHAYLTMVLRSQSDLHAIGNAAANDGYKVAGALPAGVSWIRSGYGNGNFLAVADGTSSAATSTDGKTWTSRTMSASAAWRCPTYGAGTWVAMAPGSTTASYSTNNGASWTATTMPSSAQWGPCVYDSVNAKFFASAVGNTGAYSSDGITWNAVNPGGGAGAAPIAYGDGVIVLAETGASTTFRSTDGGVTWSAGGAMPVSGSWNAMGFANGRFLATRQGTATGFSDNAGVSWTAGSCPDKWSPSASGESVFVGPILDVGSVSIGFASTDLGVDYTYMPAPSAMNNFPWNGFSVGQSTVVSLHNFGTESAWSIVNGAVTATANLTAPGAAPKSPAPMRAFRPGVFMVH